MKKFVLFLLAGVLFSGLTFAQDKAADKVGGGDVVKAKSRGTDLNIKVEKHANSATMETQAIQPTEKGAKASSRGAGSGSCYVKFDNWSGWYIDCYVDGYYEGYVAPYSDGNITTGSGSTCLYAVAEFDDGSKVSWGPVCKSCDYLNFELEVYPDYFNWYLE